MPLKLTKFNVTDYLKTPERQIAYIEAALDEDDPSFIAVALAMWRRRVASANLLATPD